MSRGTKRFEKYLGRLIMTGLVVYCIVDFINYNVIFADYGIDIPSVVKDNIAKEIEITIKCNYEPLIKT